MWAILSILIAYVAINLLYHEGIVYIIYGKPSERSIVRYTIATFNKHNYKLKSFLQNRSKILIRFIVVIIILFAFSKLVIFPLYEDNIIRKETSECMTHEREMLSDTMAVHKVRMDIT